MEKIINRIIFSFRVTYNDQKFINIYDLLAILLDTELSKYEEQIIRLANDMKLVNGTPYYKIYEEELVRKREKNDNIEDDKLLNYQLISMTKDIHFYEFMEELRKMIVFTCRHS